MVGDDRKTIKISKETFELLKSISPSPSKAIEILLENKPQNNSQKNFSNANAIEFLKEIEETQAVLENIIKLNNLRTY